MEVKNGFGGGKQNMFFKSKKKLKILNFEGAFDGRNEKCLGLAQLLGFFKYNFGLCLATKIKDEI